MQRLHVTDGDEENETMKFEKKRPRWSEHRQSYVLNFGSRVKEPSVKNTQLIKVDKNNDEEVFFQVSCIKHQFIL